MDSIFYWIGVIVCCGLGLLAAGLLISVCVNHFWRKTKEAHDFVKLFKLIKEARQEGRL